MRREGPWKKALVDYSKNRFSIPTQHYYNGAYTEETVHDITLKMGKIKKRQQPVNIRLRGILIKNKK